MRAPTFFVALSRVMRARHGGLLVRGRVALQMAVLFAVGALGLGAAHLAWRASGGFLASGLILITLPCAGAFAAFYIRLSAAQDPGILDIIEDEVWLLAPGSDEVCFVNAAGVRRTGADRLRLGQSTVWDRLPQAQHDAVRKAIAARGTAQDATVGAHVFDATVTDVQGGAYRMLVLRDVTRTRREAQMQDDFIATVSHELRSPLTSIKGSMGLLLSNAAGELPAPARGLLDIAHRNADRLVLIINDILDLQKITNGAMRFENEDVDMVDLVHEALTASALFIQRFDLEVEVIGAQVPAPLHSDPNRIFQVLGNLLTNAAKFSKPRGKITVRIERDADTVSLSIRDRGQGIPLAEQNKVFERFADMTNSDRDKNGGSGLGLSICKAIVETLGGTITFKSAENEGTTFYVVLPRGCMQAEEDEPDENMRNAS